MNLTVLIDLDGTLLQNSDSVFIPAYIELLGNYLNKTQTSEKIQKAVLHGTQIMVGNDNPGKTLEDCFDSYFYPDIQSSKRDLQDDINHFYKYFFPDLKSYTSEVSEAKLFIKNLVQENLNLVIATNPLFPRTAIMQRIEWANLDRKIDEYSLITSYEFFHFAKPNPSYYAEILAHLGWPDGVVVMIGNDWKMDIIPSEIMGIPTFYLSNEIENSGFPRNPMSSQGNWSDLNQWIKNISVYGTPFEPENSIEAYKAILLSSAALIDNLRRNSRSFNEWNTRPFPNEWSLVEIFSHIADVDAEVNLPRMKQIQIGDTPFFPAISTDEWASERNYIQNNPFEEMERFIENRKILIKEIELLPSHFLENKVNHAIFGPTKVLEIIKFITQHDRIHIQQIHDTLNQLNQNKSGL